MINLSIAMFRAVSIMFESVLPLTVQKQWNETMFPAQTCKEIKASEGQAESKKYWVSTIKPVFTVLAYCDIKTKDT